MNDKNTSPLSWIYEHFTNEHDFVSAAANVGYGKSEIRDFLNQKGKSRNDIDDIIYSAFPNFKDRELKIDGDDKYSFVITEASIATLKEIKSLPEYILSNGTCWWVRSDKTIAGLIYSNGYVYTGPVSDEDTKYSLRPVLRIEKLNANQKYFSFGGLEWYLMNPHTLICMSSIAEFKPQKDEVLWNDSATKENLEKWYLKFIAAVGKKISKTDKEKSDSTSKKSNKQDKKFSKNADNVPSLKVQ